MFFYRKLFGKQLFWSKLKCVRLNHVSALDDVRFRVCPFTQGFTFTFDARNFPCTTTKKTFSLMISESDFKWLNVAYNKRIWNYCYSGKLIARLGTETYKSKGINQCVESKGFFCVIVSLQKINTFWKTTKHW